MDKNQIYLIIDDDADDIDFFCEAIEEIDEEAECLMARNGEEALRLLRKQNTFPDCIFLDLNMPRMDGKTCLAEMKKDKGLKDIPVVIYTTSTHLKDREETLQLGADHFLTKPISFKKLCEDIRDAIEIVGQGRSTGVR
ncbi:MAG: response regulator [Pricia sp.]